MKSRLAIRSILAFCAALGLGRLMFPSVEVQPATTETAATSTTPALPALAVSTQANVAAKPDADSMTMHRAFKNVAGGVLNENARLSHFLASNYTEGTFHKAAGHGDATVRYVPATRELVRNGEIIAVLDRTQTSRAVVQNDTGNVVYPSTYSDTDERMFIRKDGGIEHDIIVKQLPDNMDSSHGLAYSGFLKLSDGLSLWDDKQQITGAYKTRNGVAIKNSKGNTVFYLRRPVAWDASVMTESGDLDKEKQSKEEYQRCAITCEYQFDFSDEGVKLSVVTPGTWLKDSAREFPVVIDPNLGPFGLGDPPIYIGTAGADTLIPANAGGTLVNITTVCNTKPDNGYGTIPMPFPFEYYNVLHPAGAPLFVHIDGFANWDPPANPCADTDNRPIPTGGYPDNAFFPYWDDLRFSTNSGSGIYYFIDGTAPQRRLVIEWFKMGYSSGTSGEVISFNLVLYECENKIQLIIGQTNETDRGLCTVGIESPGGGLGIQYDFNSAVGGFNPNTQIFGQNAFNNPFQNNNGGFQGGGLNTGFGQGVGVQQGTNTGGTNNGNTQQPITPGTSITFAKSSLGQLSVASTPRQGCLPLTVCFTTEVTVPVAQCASTQAVPHSFGFHWIFGDNAEGFTQNICHTWVQSGTYQVVAEVIDEFGNVSRLTFTVTVCDVPDVVIIASPQGGIAPLTVELSAQGFLPQANTSPITSIQLTGPNWQVDKLGGFNEPGQFVTIGTTSGSPVTARLDLPGLYRVTATFTGQDQGLNTSGVGVVFIYVGSPNDLVDDSLIITSSKFVIDWVGKRDGADPDGLPPNNGSATPGLGFPDNPEGDTMIVRGMMNLPGLSPSLLLGRRTRVILNGIDAIFDGTLDAAGNATFKDPLTGRAGTFHVDLPGGTFVLSVKRGLFVQLGLADATERRLLPAFFRFEIEGLYPPPGSPGALITYDYRSTAFNAGPPASGQAIGIYQFGQFTKDAPIVSSTDFGARPGGQEVLLTGAFFVTKATYKLNGNQVAADIKGKLARFGGDDLRPSENSDVVIGIGNYSETFNFSTTPGFKVSGKAPAHRFSFKRNKRLTKTGIAQFMWANKAGDFRIKTYALPNELVGINPALGVQIIKTSFAVTPDNNNIFNGLATYELLKKSPTQFIRPTK
jgi:hypothetical protein